MLLTNSETYMTSLNSFLSSRKREALQDVTHTWFGSSARPMPLHICQDDVPELHKLMVETINRTDCVTQSPELSLVERINREARCRLVIDVDIEAEEVSAWKDAKEYIDEKILVARLTKKMRDIVSLCRSVVAEVTGRPDIQCVLATRLPYKIHLHFPSVVVDVKTAKGIAGFIKMRCTKSHGDLVSAKAIDNSLYGAGCRMLLCHKGGIEKSERKDPNEQAIHEGMFGVGTYREVYCLTDLDTWRQKTTPAVADFQSTSVHADASSPLTAIELPSSKPGRSPRTTKSDVTLQQSWKDCFQRITVEYPLVTIVQNDWEGLGETIDIAGTSSNVRDLGENRYCPSCQCSHDSPQTSVLINDRVRQLICRKTLKTVPLGPKEVSNKI